MSLLVGQTSFNFAITGRGGVGDFAREATSTKVREATLDLFSTEAPRLGERRTESVQDSRAVNGPGAALNTIDRGVESARRIVPDVKDILDIARERFTESRQRRLDALREQTVGQEEAPGIARLLPRASAQVGRFFSSGSTEEIFAPGGSASLVSLRPLPSRTVASAEPVALNLLA